MCSAAGSHPAEALSQQRAKLRGRSWVVPVFWEMSARAWRGHDVPVGSSTPGRGRARGCLHKLFVQGEESHGAARDVPWQLPRVGCQLGRAGSAPRWCFWKQFGGLLLLYCLFLNICPSPSVHRVISGCAAAKKLTVHSSPAPPAASWPRTPPARMPKMTQVWVDVVAGGIRMHAATPLLRVPWMQSWAGGRCWAPRAGYRGSYRTPWYRIQARCVGDPTGHRQGLQPAVANTRQTTSSEAEFPSQSDSVFFVAEIILPSSPCRAPNSKAHMKYTLVARASPSQPSCSEKEGQSICFSVHSPHPGLGLFVSSEL